MPTFAQKDPRLSQVPGQRGTPARRFTTQGVLGGTQSQTASGTQQSTSGSPTIPQRATQTADTAQNALTNIINQGPRDIDETFRTVVQQPLLRDFERDILPAISRNATGTGNLFSSGRQEADARAREDLLGQLVQARTGTAFTERGNQLDRMLQASGALGNVPFQEASVGQLLANTGLIGANEQLTDVNRLMQILDAGGLERGIQQEQFATNQGLQQQRINDLMNLLGVRTTDNVVPVLPGSAGFLQGAAGGAGSAAASYFLA